MAQPPVDIDRSGLMGPTPPLHVPYPEPITQLTNVLLPSSPTTLHDIKISNGTIQSITPSPPNSSVPQDSSTGPSVDFHSCLALPSLCHPHIHLDKPYLYSHPNYSALQPITGDFAEALTLTARAKSMYTKKDLLERGSWLIAESVRSGVTHMRAFVEVDRTVDFLCLEVGFELKWQWRERCTIQLCVFAQDPIFSGPDEGQANRDIFEDAASMVGVDVIGSTPYVETSLENQDKNIAFTVRLALVHKLHLDFHLDYNIDRNQSSMLFQVFDELEASSWVDWLPRKTVCIGHCTRSTLFREREWRKVKRRIEKSALPVYFIGLPTSDIFMQGRPDRNHKERPRATLQIPSLIKDFGIGGALGVNNVGNAFTPYGSADPLSVAQLGVGLYQVGTLDGMECLYECVSVRAREAIGLGPKHRPGDTLRLKVGDNANIVVYGKPLGQEGVLYRRRRTVNEIVCDAGNDRMVVYGGKRISMEEETEDDEEDDEEIEDDEEDDEE